MRVSRIPVPLGVFEILFYPPAVLTFRSRKRRKSLPMIIYRTYAQRGLVSGLTFRDTVMGAIELARLLPSGS